MNDPSYNILVVEDNQDVLDGIINLLDYCGYKSRGVLKIDDETDQEIKAGDYDLLILDVMLSGTDGRNLTREIRKKKENEETSIILISASPDLKQSALNAGANDFLPKPFGLEELRQKVEQNLDAGKIERGW